MLTTGVVGLKGNLRKILSEVKSGQAVLITERGKAVARLVPEPSPVAPLATRLAPLYETGLALPPTRPLSRSLRPLPSIPGKSLSEIVSEDRR